MSKRILSLLLVLVMLVGCFASCGNSNKGNNKNPAGVTGDDDGNNNSGNNTPVCEHTYTNDCDTTCNDCGATRTITHTYTNGCDTTCNVCNDVRTVAPCADNDGDSLCDSCGTDLTCDHEWTNNCDATCNKCESEREAPHSYDNLCDATCNDCDNVRSVGEHKDNAGDGFVDGICGHCGADMPFAVYAGVAGKDYTDPAYYTSLDYVGGTTGLNWNPHTWETNDDSYVLGYITTPLYDFVLNTNKTGYTIIPEAAAAMPKDVTADYVGQYGIVEGESAKAWLIKLNPSVKWNDGTAINAETYVYSMKQLLDPLALNRRADSFYSGDFEIVNAKNYFYDGKTSLENVFNGSEDLWTLDELVKTSNGTYTTPNGQAMKISLGGGLNWLSGDSLAAYVNYYGGAMFDMTAWESLVAMADDYGYTPVTDESIALLQAIITYSSDWGESDADAIHYMVYENAMPKVDWDEVGIKVVSEYEFLIVTANPVSEPDFYMPYNLSSTWIVKKDLYEACQTWYDKDGNVVPAGSANAVSITSTYCTTIDKSVSFGPYDFTYLELDKQLTFERNETWFGYSDGKHLGQYQADKISCQVISEHKTALQAFLAGEIDGIGLQSADMEIYGASDRLLYTPESYTTKLTFNTDEAKLKAIGGNADVLTIAEFREAFSLAIDREAFCAAFTASHVPGYGLLNYMYCYNPFTGELYRDSDAAKKALVDLYGIDIDEYGSLEEAYDAITGYDPTKATALMATAAQKFTEKGWNGSEIVLDFRVYSTDEIYVQMFTFFDEAIKAVCVGTPFEGKISLKMTEDPDYYETMYSGNATIIFSTWGGAAMSPFSVFYQCYCDAADGSGNQMEYGFDTSKISVHLTVNGTNVTASLQEWAHWCNGDAVKVIDNALGKFTDYEYSVRCEVFAQLENVYLSHFTTIPLYYRNGTSLLSRKVDYAVDQYLQIIGYGGLRYMTFNYNDAEWNAVKGNISY